MLPVANFSPYVQFFCTLLCGFAIWWFILLYLFFSAALPWNSIESTVQRKSSALSIADCSRNATFSVLCPYKMWSKIDYRGSTERPYFTHPSALNSAFLPLYHAIALVKKCWLTTLHAPHISAPLLRRSIVATCALPLPHPPPPSFWRVGSSELVAVCTAKGNVSSTRRKVGQNIRTLTAHAQWHTALGRVNQITVSSLIPRHGHGCFHFSLLSSLIYYRCRTMAHAYIRCCNAYRKAELRTETPRRGLYANHVLWL